MRILILGAAVLFASACSETPAGDGGADAGAPLDASADAAAPDVPAGDAVSADVPAFDAMPAEDAAIMDAAPADAAAGDAASGDGSTYFGVNGFVLGPAAGFGGGGEDRLLGVAIDSAGRIVGVGYTTVAPDLRRALLVRYMPDGTPDYSFGGGDGYVIGPDDTPDLSFALINEPDDRLTSVVIDSRDRILAAGSTSLGPGRGKKTVVARYSEFGFLDRTFGDLVMAGAPPRFGYVLGRGRAEDQIPFSGYSGPSSRPEERFHTVAVDSMDRVIAAGVAAEINADFFYRTVVARFTTGGALDTSFNATGFAIGNGGDNWQGYFDEYRSVRVAAGDAVIAGGWTGLDSGYTDERTLIAKYTEAGALDPTFNAAGTPGYRLSGQPSHAGGAKEVLYGLASAPGGAIVTAGFSFEPGGSRIRVLTERLTAAGVPDPAYAGGFVLGGLGELTGADQEYLVAVAVDGAGRVVAAGFNDLTGATDNVDQAFVVRYTAAGVPDATFAAAGELGTWTGGQSELAGGQDDGYFAVAAGAGDVVYAAGTSNGRMVIARYRSDGCLDKAGPCTH